jgi:WASH complex subunit strumpellin
MEHKIGGLLRERLLVAHLRYKRCFSYPNLEQICELCRRHVPTPGTSASSGSSPFSPDIISIQKPEDLLRRFPLPEPVVNAVITCLRNGDVYNNLRFYPDPQHRTTALSLQGGHLYVLLFYSHDLLHRGLAMREIVDRFFKDNWVVPIFLHFSVDLLASWDAYKEAKSSLVSCLSPTSIRDISLHHYTKVSIAKHFILLLSKIFLFWMLVVNCSSIPTFFSLILKLVELEIFSAPLGLTICYSFPDIFSLSFF